MTLNDTVLILWVP